MSPFKDLPEFHDENLRGIISEGNHVRLFFGGINNFTDHKRTLVINKVDQLIAEEFLQGNIVFDFTFIHATELPTLPDWIKNAIKNYFENQYLNEDKMRANLTLMRTSYGCHGLISGPFEREDIHLIEGWSL